MSKLKISINTHVERRPQRHPCIIDVFIAKSNRIADVIRHDAREPGVAL